MTTPRRSKPLVALGIPALSARAATFALAALLALPTLLALLAFIALPSPAQAKSHLWKFKEIFSNADGTIQYVEMDVVDPAGTGEWQTFGSQLASSRQVYTIPINLAQVNTFQRSMLFATPAFAALPGAPTPDFIIPAGFMNPLGDELRYRFTLDVFAYAAGELPRDGHRALVRSDRSQPINSPENFAGATTTIDASHPEVDGVWPPLLGFVVVAAFFLRRRLVRAVGPA